MIALAFLGQARLHQHRFVLFLAIVMALAVAVVVAFLATEGRDDPGLPARPRRRTLTLWPRRSSMKD